MTKTLMIQGTSSGAGKTTLVAALCRIFTKKGYTVCPFKSQNMSNFAYVGDGFEISRAQAIQAIAANSQIIPEINPVLLKPLGDYQSSVFLNGKFYKKMHADEYYQKFVKSKGLNLVLDSFKKLEKNHDLIIIEGAGSPAEINLSRFDISNMKIAQKTKSPVILITDIDRGGSFASIVGTLQLLDKSYQKLVKGFVFNKFRGDIEILKPGFRKLKKITGRPVFGTIPMTKTNLPEEDSLNANPKEMKWTKQNIAKIDSALDKLSNHVNDSLDINAIERLL